MAINEPVEFCQKRTGKVTARQLLDVVRSGNDSVYMHGEAAIDRASYSDAFVFTVSAVSKYGKAEKVTKIDVPGWVSNGQTSVTRECSNEGARWTVYANAYRPSQGFWYIDRHKDGRLAAILELLPRDAEVSFHVYLDAGTNEYLVTATSKLHHYVETGLHADSLFLVAQWSERGKVKERTFLIDTSCGAHNSARFGSPRHANDGTGGRG